MAGERLKKGLRVGAALTVGLGAAACSADATAGTSTPASAPSTRHGVEVVGMPSPYVHATMDNLALTGRRGDIAVYRWGKIRVTEQLHHGRLSVTEQLTGKYPYTQHADLSRGQQAIFTIPVEDGGLVVATFPKNGKGPREVWTLKPRRRSV